MSKLLVSDELWAVIAPLLPPEPPKPQGGRPRLDDRRVLTGIIFVLKSGIGWDLLPSDTALHHSVVIMVAIARGRSMAILPPLHRRFIAPGAVPRAMAYLNDAGLDSAWRNDGGGRTAGKGARHGDYAFSSG